MITNKKPTFVKLGYSHMDTAEIVVQLNRIVAGYSVFQQKLKCFHWNITGADFFDIHNQFEEMYKMAAVDIDEIAERIRLFGQIPVASFREFLNQSTIKEGIQSTTSFEMNKLVLADLRLLLETMEEAVNAANKIGDNGTIYMLQKIIYQLEKKHWMLTAWMKQKDDLST